MQFSTTDISRIPLYIKSFDRSNNIYLENNYPNIYSLLNGSTRIASRSLSESRTFVSPAHCRISKCRKLSIIESLSIRTVRIPLLQLSWPTMLCGCGRNGLDPVTQDTTTTAALPPEPTTCNPNNCNNNDNKELHDNLF